MAALASEHITIWWISIGMGLVLVIAVIVLLSLLVALVDDIDKGVLETWETATRVARNTATTWMITQAAMNAERLRDEVRRHAAMLGATGGR